MKKSTETASSVLTNLAMPLLSRGSLIWLGFVAALLMQDSLRF